MSSTDLKSFHSVHHPRIPSHRPPPHPSRDSSPDDDYPPSRLPLHPPSSSSSSQGALSPRSREYLRLRVNARERQRMHDMNSALDALRTSMPYAQGPAVKKLSKMNTLLLARNYISLLTRTLEELRRLLAETHSRQSLPWSPRLDAVMRNQELYAQQQRYAEELIRREQLLQLQADQQLTAPPAASRKRSASPSKDAVSPPTLGLVSSSAESYYTMGNGGGKRRRVGGWGRGGKTPVGHQPYPDVVGSLNGGFHKEEMSVIASTEAEKDGVLFRPHKFVSEARDGISPASSPERVAMTSPLLTSQADKDPPLQKMTSPSFVADKMTSQRVHEKVTSHAYANRMTSSASMQEQFAAMAAAAAAAAAAHQQWRGTMPCPCPHCYEGKASAAAAAFLMGPLDFATTGKRLF